MHSIFIICAFLLYFSLAMPVITLHPTSESPRGVNAKAHAVNKRTHASADCILFAEYRDIGQSTNSCGLAPIDRVVPRSHSLSSEDISGRNGHNVPAAGTPPKSSSTSDTNTPHWYHRFDYRRSPSLEILREEDSNHRRDPFTNPITSRMEPTQSSSSTHNDAVDLRDQPRQTQEAKGSQANGWGAYYWDWKL